MLRPAGVLAILWLSTLAFAAEPTPHPRLPRVTLRVRFPTNTLAAFIARYGGELDGEGIFIRTERPLGLGTRVRLDLKLGDGTPIVDGEGLVVWLRASERARADAPAGYGVRFLKLSEASQRLLEKVASAARSPSQYARGKRDDAPGAR